MAILGNNQFTDPNYFTIDTAGGTNNKVNVCKTDPAPCDGLVEKVTALIRHTRPGGVALDYNKIVICYENGIIIENGVSDAYLWTDYEYDVPVWVDFTFPAFPTIVSGTTYLIYNITSYNATSTYYSLEVGRGLGGRIGTIAEVNQAYNSPVRLYKPVIELDDRRAIMYITFSGTYGGSWDRHLNNGDGFEPSDNCTQWDIVSTSFKPANQHSYASVGLTASGTWKENYKPSKGKVNAKGLSDADGDLLNISIYDSSFNEITSVADYSLGDDFTLNFSGTGDIDSMYISVVDSNLASWNFSTTTTEGDPGNTYMRFNNADLNAVTAIYIDPIDYNSTDQSQYIERLYRASNKKTLQFLLNGSDCVNPSFVKFTVDSVENKGGYYKLNVTPTLSSGTFNNDAWLDTTTVVRPNFEVTDIIFYEATSSGVEPNPPASGTWVAHLYDTTGFTSDECASWDGTKFAFAPVGAPGATFTPGGTWATNYRPTKMRITCSGLSEAENNTFMVFLNDTNTDSIATEMSYTSPNEMNITFGDYDIGELYVQMNEPYQASWKFSSTTTSGDPGSTYFRMDSGTLSSVTKIYIDPLDRNSTNQTVFITGLNSIREGILRFTLDGTTCTSPTHAEYIINSVEDCSGFYTINVTYSTSSGSFVNNSIYGIVFVPSDFAITNIEFYEPPEEGGDGGGTMYLYSKSAWDGPMYDSNATWSTVRASNDPDNAYPTNAMTTPSIQSWLNSGTYYIYRVWLWFDCGPLQGSTIDSAKLSIYAYNASDSWGEDVTILKSTHPDEAIDRWNYYFDAFTTDNYGTLNVPYTDGMSYARHEVELNAAGLAYVQACAASGTYAKFCLITTDHDYANSAPTAGSATEINMYYSLFNADHDPRLEIAFTGDSWAPTINAWNDITNTDFWENTPISEPHTSWNGSAWVVDASSSNGLNIKTGSIWQKGFRPTQMRITLSAGGFSYFELWDEDENAIASFSLSGPGGEDTQEISYSGYDLNIKKLGYQSGGSGATITKIEVYVV